VTSFVILRYFIYGLITAHQQFAMHYAERCISYGRDVCLSVSPSRAGTVSK